MATESREHAAHAIEPAVSILLVDDDESLCGMMSQVLPYSGMRLDAVHNGYLGLREALQGRHDLLILDMRLPGLGGLEVLRQVRRRSPVPVIMITASSDEADRVSGLDAGADDYLSKPFGIDELLARIRAVLRRTGRVSQTRPTRLVASGITIETGLREVRIGADMVQVTSTEYRTARISGPPCRSNRVPRRADGRRLPERSLESGSIAGRARQPAATQARRSRLDHSDRSRRRLHVRRRGDGRVSLHTS